MSITPESIRAAGGIVHRDGNIFFASIEQLRTLAAAPAASTDPVLAVEPALPAPGSLEASRAIDTLLAEYDYPSNPKNAARAGWEAARRTLASAPSPHASVGAVPVGNLDAAFLTDADMSDLKRFQETTEDDQSYDLSKSTMLRLAELGVVGGGTGGRFYLTSFGRMCLCPGSDFSRRPLETVDECNERLGREHAAAMGQSKEEGDHAA